MTYTVFAEQGDYYAFCNADKQPDGSWSSSVTFERKADHAAKKARIEALKHVLNGAHPNEHDAVQAALVYAATAVQQGDVGL